MAIYLFNEHPLKQPVSFSDDNTAATRTRTFQIITDDAADDESVILLDSRVPVRYAAHPLDANFTVRNRELERQGESFIEWLLTVEYSDAPLTEQDQENQARQLEPNPLARPAVIEWEGLAREIPIVKDRLGVPICNSAGDAFEAGAVTATVFDMVAIVTKNVLVVPLWLLQYQGAVNSASFEIDGVTAETGCARLGGIKISGWQQENGYVYRVLTMPIHFRVRRDPAEGETESPEPWLVEVLDQGMRYKDGSDRKHIMDDSTPPNPITSPVPLNGSGAVLANPSATNLVFLEYDVHNRRDFSALPLT